ncbi:MAG: hypothetical protein ACXACP_03870 [Candidatus Hodarchaeales archaeon]|jgi:hypothetical protein
MHKNQQVSITLLIGFFCLSIIFPINLSTASIVWSDNFSDGNADGWTISGLNHSVGGAVNPWEGNMSVKRGMLTSGEDFGPPGIDGYHLYSWASHPSEVAVGTWRFDLDLTSPSAVGGGLNFISNSGSDPGWPWILYGYQIRVNVVAFVPWDENIPGAQGFFLQGSSGGVDVQHSIDNCAYEGLGIYRFIITRDSTGFFDVYINESLKMSGHGTDVVPARKFEFVYGGSVGVDNISVSNTIDFDQAPPHLEAEIPFLECEEGQMYELPINVTDPSGIDYWWLEKGDYDNDLFTIDQNGVIRNNTVLTQKKYHIAFSVNDTKGFTLVQYYNFFVVEPTITPTTTTTTTTNTSGIESLVFIVILSLGLVAPFRKRKK